MITFLLIFIIAACIIAAFIRFVLFRFWTPSIPATLRALVALVGIVGGLILIYIGSTELNEQIERHNWPEVKGLVLHATIEGERAFYPKIVYQYKVGSDLFVDSSDLDIPAFGGKRKRYDVAKKRVLSFVPGDSLSVFYNPDRPDSSTIYNHVKWSVYVRPGFYLILLALGLSVALPFRKKII